MTPKYLFFEVGRTVFDCKTTVRAVLQRYAEISHIDVKKITNF